MTKLKDIFNELNITTPNKNNLLHNLTQPPKKEPYNVAPHTTAPQKFATEQADLLFLPDDDGYKYLLVVTDIATRLTDAEPLKSKDSLYVAKAMKRIFKRKILKEPMRLEVDSGSEFKGEFKKAFNNIFNILVKIAGRHRQQSVVEHKNYIIGTILNKRMLAEEIIQFCKTEENGSARAEPCYDGESNNSWIDILPKVIQSINKHYSFEPKIVKGDAQIRTDKFSQDVLPEGTKVRIQLDNPTGYVEGKRLHGKFRTGDIRWTRDTHTITQFYLRPDQPVMYQLDNNDNVAYTKYQLQVVNDDEEKPKSTLPKKWIVEKLVKKFKKNNKLYYLVKWEGYKKLTEEPRSILIKDIPELIKEFEAKT
jgi:hypothetical protein